MNWRHKYKKAVTFSYDDGVGQDIRLAELFNKYNLKCTFNVNSGIQYDQGVWMCEGVEIHRCNTVDLKNVYIGHEAAIHTLTHPQLCGMNKDQIRYEVMEDKHNLEKIFGYEVNGMAYPFGSYDESVLEVLKDNGILYSRTTNSSYTFKEQQELLTLQPTCHHNDLELMNLAKQFAKLKPEEPQIFYIWGHSYEFDVKNNWEQFEQFCQYISNRDDIFYGTNSEVLLKDA